MRESCCHANSLKSTVTNPTDFPPIRSANGDRNQTGFIHDDDKYSFIPTCINTTHERRKENFEAGSFCAKSPVVDG